MEGDALLEAHIQGLVPFLQVLLQGQGVEGTLPQDHLHLAVPGRGAARQAVNGLAVSALQQQCHHCFQLSICLHRMTGTQARRGRQGIMCWEVKPLLFL